MDNINNLDFSNKYVQGSLWKWINNSEKKVGVQSSERPVLIISNNTFNYKSMSVNCVSITSVLKESPVHVPIHILMDSHILCEQVHTIPKSELVEYMGIVPNSTLSNVKAKLRLQFDMSTDRNTELFKTINKNLQELNSKTEPDILNAINANLEKLLEKADKGFGLPNTEDELLNLLINLHDGFKKVTATVENFSVGYTKMNPPLFEISGDNEKQPENTENGIKSPPKIEKPGRGNRRKYTEKDKYFIADKNNSIDDVMEKFGYDRTTAHKMRAYFKKRIDNGNIRGKRKTAVPDNNPKPLENSTKRVYRSYTDDDKRFIINKENTIADLIEKFGFKDEQAAYKARANIKKNFAE